MVAVLDGRSRRLRRIRDVRPGRPAMRAAAPRIALTVCDRLDKFVQTALRPESPEVYAGAIRRYELTSDGRRLAVFYTKTYTRIVNPSLAELDPPCRTRSPNDPRAPPLTAPSNAPLRKRSNRPLSPSDKKMTDP
jgi:hypothetical protein